MKVYLLTFHSTAGLPYLFRHVAFTEELARLALSGHRKVPMLIARGPAKEEVLLATT